MRLLRNALLLCAVLVAFTANAADVVRYVNTASTTGGDGTTNATSGANRAYPTCAAWNTAEATDLVAAGNTHTVYFSGAQDTGGRCDLIGWTTGASNRLTLAGNPSDLSHGTWSTSHYYLSPSDTFNGAIELRTGAEYVTVQDLQVENRGALGSQDSVFETYATATTSSDIRFLRNVIRLSGTGTAGSGDNAIELGANDLTSTVVDNIILTVNGGNNGIYARFIGTAVHYAIYDNTIVGAWAIGLNNEGASGSAAIYLRNNVVSGSTTDYSDGGSTHSGNCSADATSPDTGCRSVTFTFAGAGDYHLSASDVGAIDKGSDLSGDSIFAFSDDIDGQTRSGTWDSGADEYVSVGGGSGLLLRRRR